MGVDVGPVASSESRVHDVPQPEASNICLVAQFICFPCFEINTVNLGHLHSLDECEKMGALPCAILGGFGRWGLFALALGRCCRSVRIYGSFGI